MRILLSNDDGIHAPGLQVLERIAHTLSDDVWIVAPENERSGAGHSLTLHRPLRIRHVSEKKFAVAGTPTDCIMMAVSHVMKDCLPDLVLSGVNHGGNFAEDVTYSGTVAVAMEATLCGLKAIALSQVVDPLHPTKWSTAEHHAPQIIRRLIEESLPENTLININFPDVVASSVKGIRVTRQGKRKVTDNMIERIDPRGKPYFWIGNIDYKQSGPEGTDIKAIAEGCISITPLSLDLTDHLSLNNLKKAMR